MSVCVMSVTPECLFFSCLGTGGEQREVEVPKQEAKLLIEDFDPSKEYNFKISAVSGSQQSKPLQAKHEGKTLPLCSSAPRCSQKPRCSQPVWAMSGHFTASSSSAQRSGVEMVESQSTQEGGVTEEDNEITEGKIRGGGHMSDRKTASSRGNGRRRLCFQRGLWAWPFLICPLRHKEVSEAEGSSDVLSLLPLGGG